MSEIDQSGKKKGSKTSAWSRTELEVSVDAYLYLLRLEAAKVPFSASSQEKLLAAGVLSSRNDASIRYRLRNISYVMQERGEKIVKAYSPAPQVGKNVQKVLNDLLDERVSTLDSIRQTDYFAQVSQPNIEKVLSALGDLKELISSQSRMLGQVGGIGHNSPPEAITVEEREFDEAVVVISRIEQELSSGQPNRRTIGERSQVLINFGMNCAVWVGQRFTDFAKAGAVAAGTAAGLSLSGLGTQIVDVLKQVFAFIF